MFELVNPTTNAGGTVVVQAEAFDANSGGTAGFGFDAINHNRYWSAQITGGAANFTNTTVRLTEQGTVAANAIGQSASRRAAPTTRSAAPSPARPSARATQSPRWATSPSAGSPARPPSAAHSRLGPAATTPTLTAAVADLNTKLMTGPVTFLLTDNTYAGETLPIVINPNGGNSARTR